MRLAWWACVADLADLADLLGCLVAWLLGCLVGCLVGYGDDCGVVGCVGCSCCWGVYVLCWLFVYVVVNPHKSRSKFSVFLFTYPAHLFSRSDLVELEVCLITPC